MRPTTALALGAVTALVAVGCAQAEADDDEVTLRLSHFMDPAHPHETCGVETLQEELEGTGVTVESYPSWNAPGVRSRSYVSCGD